ncbi:MAG: pyridoxamine 5'-phosphate oxidase [Bacteroidia bacterium]|nr:pyridoxamine 5'-phosphate oxidase [Bacteroidia bacterium]
MTHNEEIAALRSDYRKSELLEHDVDPNPIHQFRIWFDNAMNAEIAEPNAMCLCTVHLNQPDSRIVLLKAIKDEGFVFFTNYHSSKGLQIEANPQVALNIVWLELERQVRVEGVAHKISEEESDHYFYSRPFESQVGAIVSAQSEQLSSREDLELAMQTALEKYKSIKPVRPKHWGGYIVVPTEIEFWQGRTSRLHDRLQYRLINGVWNIVRLFP